MKIQIAALALTAGLMAAGSAVAQAQPTNPGPVIPGVCTFDQGRAIATSSVGQAVDARLQELLAAVNAELTPEATAIQTEYQTLQSQAQALAQEELQQRAGALQQRAAEFEARREQLFNELGYTREVQLQTIQEAMNPLLAQVYVERGCGLLIDRSAIYGANPAMDVSDRVTELLNGTLATLTFDRLAIPQQGQ